MQYRYGTVKFGTGAVQYSAVQVRYSTVKYRCGIVQCSTGKVQYSAVQVWYSKVL